jgi:hypothetical protein
MLLQAVAQGLLIRECSDNLSPFSNCSNIGVLPVARILGWIVLAFSIITLGAVVSGRVSTSSMFESLGHDAYICLWSTFEVLAF